MRILEVEFLSHDLDTTLQFYNGLLQFEITRYSPESFTFNAGFTTLTFRRSESDKPRYHFAFNIPRNKIEESLLWAQERVEVITTENNSKIVDFSNWNAKAFYFYDNNGNVVEFIARNNLEYEAQEPFTANSIMALSEIGIVSDNFSETCENLKKKFSLEIFRNTFLAGFAALGDDNGLFIVVETNRDWYLTDLPATKHWQRIVVEIAGERKELIYHPSAKT